tara:strand:- start:445 stop:804 length:360 start_codon:yes stop_codon:yes gene_type:complete
MATLKDVKHLIPARIEACRVVGTMSTPCADIEPIDVIETEMFIEQILLNEKSKVLIESSLQGLCSDSRGLLLLTSFGEYDDYLELVMALDDRFDSVKKDVQTWGLKGINEISIHFADGR